MSDKYQPLSGGSGIFWRSLVGKNPTFAIVDLEMHLKYHKTTTVAQSMLFHKVIQSKGWKYRLLVQTFDFWENTFNRLVLVFPAMYSMVSNWGFTFAESAFIFQSISLPVKAEIQAMVYPLYYKITADNTGILTKWMQTTDWCWLAQSTFLETRNFKAHLSAGRVPAGLIAMLLMICPTWIFWVAHFQIKSSKDERWLNCISTKQMKVFVYITENQGLNE